MKTNARMILGLFGFMLVVCACSCSGKREYQPQIRTLEDGWKVQSAARVPQPGEAISESEFAASGWYATAVPATVMAVLTNQGVYKDIYFGKNLEKIPEEPFKSPWWYRNEFDVEKTASFANARLVFEGINYRANIFLNGKKIAAADKTFGAYRIFDLDVSQVIQKGKNILAVEVIPPVPGEPTIGFVDWNPKPPDRSMGIFRPVRLKLTGPVSIEHPFVTSQVDLQTLKEARLTVTAKLTNHGDAKVRGTVKGKIGKIFFNQAYFLNPGESREIVFNPETFPQLVIQEPKLWWPAGMGDQELYDLRLSALVDGGLSDRQGVRFGIRQIDDYVDEYIDGYIFGPRHRGYKVNGRKVLIRGGGWVDELLLREDKKRLEAQVRYARHMNLNTIRLEGIWGSSHKLYDLCDQYGIMLMTGWSCQWEWEDYLGKPQESEMYGAASTKEDMDLLAAYFRDQVLWLRHHPSIFVWVVGSDKLPWPDMEKRYRQDLKGLDSSRPMLTSCKTWTSEISGSSAVKMNGPYDYVPPNYWYVDTTNGGAFGFNTETGPGPQPPPLESLKKMIPADKLWPINDVWNFHCARNEFNTLDRYLQAFNTRYGPARSVEEFAFKAQVANYEAMRAMFEAFAARRPVTTGIIQWMYNAAWPKLYWQFYDYYLMPTGAFYGARKACQPLTLVYDYGNRGIYLVNQSYKSYTNLQAVLSVWNNQSRKLFSKTLPVDGAANFSRKIFSLANIPGTAPAYFLDLKLLDGTGRLLGDNFYWLSTKPDVLDYQKNEWFVTPCKSWADLTSLQRLPQTPLETEHHFTRNGKEGKIAVTLRNPGQTVAFFIEMSVRGEASGKTVVPVFWSDNYVSLLPGESRTFSATFAAADLGGEKPVFRYQGWNVPGNE